MVEEGDGFSIKVDSHDFFSGRRSMSVHFDGTTNAGFAHLRQQVPISGNGRYVLEGQWKAEEITTRSGVYFEMLTKIGDAEGRAKIAARWGSWDWQRFRLSLDLTNSPSMLEIRLRRNPTKFLDKNISGKLWIDDVTLTRAY